MAGGIRGVFFDLGGTLYSYRRIPATTLDILQEMVERMDLGLGLDQTVEHYRLANREADEFYADRPFYLFRDYFETIFHSFLRRVDREHLAHDFAWFEEQHRVRLMGCMDLRPDCHETLSALKTQGLYLSVVSNSDENMLNPLVERAELHRWLDHWTSSEAARSCKPDPGFFEVALEKSGLDPEQVLFVGDSTEQDIQGAHAAGMTTVLITELDAAAPMHIGRETVDPDFHTTSLSGVLEIVESLRTSG